MSWIRKGTGEMSASEVLRESYPFHFAIADAIGGEVRPWDQYQGPYVTSYDTGRIWLTTGEDGSPIAFFEKWNEEVPTDDMDTTTCADEVLNFLNSKGIKPKPHHAMDFKEQAESEMCQCGHTAGEHQDLDGPCIAGGDGCPDCEEFWKGDRGKRPKKDSVTLTLPNPAKPSPVSESGPEDVPTMDPKERQHRLDELLDAYNETEDPAERAALEQKMRDLRASLKTADGRREWVDFESHDDEDGPLDVCQRCGHDRDLHDCPEHGEACCGLGYKGKRCGCVDFVKVGGRMGWTKKGAWLVQATMQINEISCDMCNGRMLHIFDSNADTPSGLEVHDSCVECGYYHHDDESGDREGFNSLDTVNKIRADYFKELPPLSELRKRPNPPRI